jgi:hypothetical protein
MDATEKAGGGGHGMAVEPDRVSTRTVVGFGVALTVITAIAMLVVVGLFKLLDRGAVKNNAATVAGAGLQNQPDRLPPAPRLQISGSRDWQDYRAAEQERLTTYGWMDRGSGAVHIPIERAMALVAERGVGPLPPGPSVAPPAPAPAAAPPEKKR